MCVCLELTVKHIFFARYYAAMLLKAEYKVIAWVLNAKADFCPFSLDFFSSIAKIVKICNLMH